MKDVSLELPASVFNVEQRFWHTLKAIFVNPYKLTKDYSGGKRKYYSPPVQFFFFFATLSFIIDNIFVESSPVNIDINTNVHSSEVQVSEIITQSKWASDKFLFISENYSNYFELGVPLFFGLILTLFVRKKMNLAETLTFSFYVFSIAYYIPFLVLLPFTKYIGELESVLTVLLVAVACASIGKRRILNFILGIVVFGFTISAYFLSFIVVLFVYRFITS